MMVKTTVVTLLAAVSMLGAACATPDVSSEGEPDSEVVEGEASTEDAEQEAEAEPDEPEPAESDPEPEPEAAEEDPVPDRIELEVVDSGFSTYVAYDDSTRASWGVVIANPNEDQHIASRVDVTVTLLDGEGTVLGSESDGITAILPGQEAALGGSTFEDISELSEIRVQVRARDWELQPGPFGSFTTSGVQLRASEFGGWTVTGTVASDFVEDFVDVYAVAILRDAGGNIVGGDWTFLDFVPAGGDTSFEVDVSSDVEGVESADVYVMMSNLSLLQ